MTLLRATLCDVDPRRYNQIAPALRLIKERHALPVRIVGRTAYLEFTSVKNAKAVMKHQSETFNDSAALVGRQTDSLVRALPQTRINTGLWHILLYVLEGKLTYNATNRKWTIGLTSRDLRSDIRQWLVKYLLTTDE